jgi:hypothetical protein
MPDRPEVPASVGSSRARSIPPDLGENSGTFNFVGKRYPQLTGEGRLQPDEHDDMDTAREDTEDEKGGPIDVSTVAAAGLAAKNPSARSVHHAAAYAPNTSRRREAISTPTRGRASYGGVQRAAGGRAQKDGTIKSAPARQGKRK